MYIYFTLKKKEGHIMHIYNVTKEFWFTANLTEHWPPEDSEH